MFESIHVSVPKIMSGFVLSIRFHTWPYNPKTSNENWYLEFERSINRADNITNAFIITAGDFNLPGWDWKTKSLKANTQHVNIHHKFTDPCFCTKDYVWVCAVNKVPYLALFSFNGLKIYI
jgi:hypothetical protein